MIKKVYTIYYILLYIVKSLQVDFKLLVEKHESQALTTKNILDKEKQDALVVA